MNDNFSKENFLRKMQPQKNHDCNAELVNFPIGYAHVWISENKWADDQVLEVSVNKTTLTLTSSQDDKILEWILSCGPDAKPVEPNEFVQRWKDKICEMAELAGI